MATEIAFEMAPRVPQTHFLTHIFFFPSDFDLIFSVFVVSLFWPVQACAVWTRSVSEKKMSFINMTKCLPMWHIIKLGQILSAKIDLHLRLGKKKKILSIHPYDDSLPGFGRMFFKVKAVLSLKKTKNNKKAISLL